jgi:hypothetical protein
MKSIALSALLLAACAEDTVEQEAVPREAQRYEIVPAKPQPQLDKEGRAIPGTVVFDTSEGRMDITQLLPEAPREFGTWDDFHQWAAEALNARIVEADGGEHTSTLVAGYGPTVRYDADAAELVPVDDPIAAIVGGTFGYIYVKGELVCVDPAAACAAEQTREPARMENHIGQVVTNTNNGLTVTGSSSIFHLFAVHEIKASTSLNASRGFSQSTYSCGFFGLGSCTSTTGSDTLSASFSAYRSTGSLFNGSNAYSQKNTTAVATSHWGFGIAYSSSSPVYVTPGSAGVVSLTDSMCSRHGGSDNIGFVSFSSMSGYHPYGGGC